MQTATSLWQKISLVFLGLLLSLALLEVGMRLGGFILLSIQEYGNLQSLKHKDAYRILCLGESTTQGEYPKPLEKILNQRNIGVRFSVIDRGRGAKTTNTLLEEIESNLAEFHPDMVVAMMGINDRGIRYYHDIPEPDTWLSRHCRVYRFGRILYGHILTKIRHEDIYGLIGSGPGMKATSEGAGTVAKKAGLANGIPLDEVTKLDLRDTKKGAGPRSFSLSNAGLPRAAKSLKKAIQPDSKNHNSFVILGTQYQNQGKFAQAEDSFKKAIELDPKNNDAYVELGFFYTNQAKLSQAEDFFKKALELNPKSDIAYVGLGWLYRDQGNFVQAEGSFKKALELNSENGYAYSGLGSLYYRPDDLPQAEEFYKKAIELDPENDRDLFSLGRTYLNQGKFPQAEEFYRKALKLNPENDFALFDLGGLYRKQGKFHDAEDLFIKALVTFPQDERLLGALASLYEEMGKPELVKAYAGKANRLKTDYYATITVNNYRKLKNILDRKGIKLVCVQYPVRNVEPLKRIFEKNEGVIFVDNEQVFKEAVKRSGYKEYFRDMFAGDFGHCTQKGNELLAQNIADVILRKVFNR
jgi:tetratricopeptide (TPR) repeat protein